MTGALAAAVPGAYAVPAASKSDTRVTSVAKASTLTAGPATCLSSSRTKRSRSTPPSPPSSSASISSLTQAVRELWGNDQPLAAGAAFPMHHPIPFAIGWIILITAVMAPLAIRAFRARTAD